MPTRSGYVLNKGDRHMGQIANQMALELFFKMKDRLKEKRQAKKGECHAQNSDHRAEHKGNEN